MPLVTRLDHIALACENTADAVAWYGKALGLVVLLEGPPKPSGQRGYFIGLPHAPGEGLSKGMMLELIPKNDFPRHARQTYEPGYDHIAFSAPDFDAALAHLEKGGIKHLGVGAAFGGGRVVTMHDPEGNLVQIVERK
jgi:catechol 2,3-dioxygenase-like lactoylglutathione lyase family enzyme